jgi:hypothetical protein
VQRFADYVLATQLEETTFVVYDVLIGKAATGSHVMVDFVRSFGMG